MIKNYTIVRGAGSDSDYYYIRLFRDGEYFTQLTAIYLSEEEAQEDADALLQWADS